ncbi:hypothetical protein WN943_018682 [Citrus x changshan-huyou]
MVRIGFTCLMESPQDRMNTTTVVDELKSIKNIHFGPRRASNMQKGNRMMQILLQLSPR